MSQALISNSILLIGEKYQTKVVWVQIYETSQTLKEEKLRVIIRDIKTHVQKNRIKSGAARVFKTGKLAFYEIPDKLNQGRPSKIYCLYTQEKKIGVIIKKAIQSIADRGGGYTIYSAKRFFSEMIDLVQDPKILDSRLNLTENDVVDRIEKYYTQAYDANELGQIISFLNNSEKLNWETLEKIYLHVYESLQSMLDGSAEDPDEFLDAAYIIARSYEHIDNYRLGLELLKYITVVAAMNQRYDLETSCKIRIAAIYKEYFPPFGEYIIEALSTVAELHLLESAKPDKEIYYSLLGHAYALDKASDKSLFYYEKAIEEAGVNISSPIWIADAYNYLGETAQNDYYFVEAIRLYLTAATIAFSEGDLTKADLFRNNAARVESLASEVHIKSALGFRMENNMNDAEYKAWLSLRYLIRAFIHGTIQSQRDLIPNILNILNEAEVVLNIPGKMRSNKSVINKITKFISDVEDRSMTAERLEKKLVELEKTVEININIPPPTFMLITLDGQLTLMGKIEDNKWVESEIKGAILGGILVAIMSLITEVTGKTSLRTIDAGIFKIMTERSENAVVALLLDREIPEFRGLLRDMLTIVDNKYSNTIRYWKGNMSLFHPLRGKIVEMFSKPYE